MTLPRRQTTDVETADDGVQRTGLPARLVLYDGVCVVCNRTVQQLLKIDRERRLRFAPLQGSTAAAVRRRHPEIPADLDSIVYVETTDGEERVFWWSEAIFRIYADLHVQSLAMKRLQQLPRWVVDIGYRVFARGRYRVFGKLDACPLPPPEDRARFLP
jgi:predicted DCC family thiol-disulfide oxidoreductase YuxK